MFIFAAVFMLKRLSWLILLCTPWCACVLLLLLLQRGWLPDRWCSHGGRPESQPVRTSRKSRTNPERPPTTDSEGPYPALVTSVNGPTTQRPTCCCYCCSHCTLCALACLHFGFLMHVVHACLPCCASFACFALRAMFSWSTRSTF